MTGTARLQSPSPSERPGQNNRLYYSTVSTRRIFYAFYDYKTIMAGPIAPGYRVFIGL